MADRFAWGAGELEPDADEVAEAADVVEGRHSAGGWNEDLHPRNDDGKFGHGGGSSGAGSPAPAPSSGGGSGRHSGGAAAPGSGSPAGGSHRAVGGASSNHSIATRSGGAIAMNRHADGSVTVDTKHGTTTLNKHKAAELRDVLTSAPKKMGVGEEWYVKHDSEIGVDGLTRSKPAAMISRTDEDTFALRFADGDQSYAELKANPGLVLDEDQLGTMFHVVSGPGDKPAPSTPPGGPTPIAVATSGGDTITVTRGEGGTGGTISVGQSTLALGEDEYQTLSLHFGHPEGGPSSRDAIAVGEQRTIPYLLGTTTSGIPPLGTVKRTGPNTFELHLRPHAGATDEEIAAAPGIDITSLDGRHVSNAMEKFDYDAITAARKAREANKAEAIRTGRTNPADIGRRATGQPPSTQDPDSRGMPGTIVAAEIPSTGGDTVTVHRQPGSEFTHLSGNGRSVALNDDEIWHLGSKLSHDVEEDGDWDDGETVTVTDDNGHTFASVTRRGKLREVHIDGQPAFTVDDKAGARIQKAADPMSTAKRVDTGYGTYDVFVNNRKPTIRHLGDDGRPVEVAFDKKSWNRVQRAIAVVDEGFDEMDEDPNAPSSGITSKDVTTNVGPVRVSLKGGPYGASNSRLSVAPVEGDAWGVVVDGPSMNAFQYAFAGLLEAQKPYLPAGQVSLVEAAGGQADFQRASQGRYSVLLIKAGQGSSGYYSEAVLRRDGPTIFPAGTRMNMDHPTPTEQAERPEGSTLTWASVTTTDPYWDPAQKGLVADVRVFPHWRDTLNEEFAKELGLSIRATGTVEWGDINGQPTKIVTSLDEGISVDWVTKAGAGGRVLELIESARSEGELLEEKGNLAPPFTKADGKAKKGEKPDDEDAKADDEKADDDEDDAKKKDGKMPAFLKAKFKGKEASVSEAATVGAYFESRIHSDFTRGADDMYGEGRLTRDERKALSSAIGEALDAFTRRVEADNPHLYQRDLWADPAKAVQGAMTENTDMEGAPMSGSTNEKQAPPERGTDVTESARVSELTTALAEARRVATALTEAQTATVARLDDLETRLAESDAEKLDLTNDKDARKVVAEALKTSGLLAASHARVTESVVRDLPTDDDGVLDTAKLAKAIKAAIDDKRAELAEALESAGVGSVRGLGESASRERSESDIDKLLEEAFAGTGMNEKAALTAARGRG